MPVQLPLYNERYVVERLLEAVARLDYPARRLEIQVLDDSTDETRAIVARDGRELRARGHRGRAPPPRRAHGFQGRRARRRARASRAASSIAVFDADFVPAPDFLRRLVPHFADPRVGMVQARWGHLNRD